MRAAGGGEGAGFPWDRAMALGFGLLRLDPATFWAMTPRELERALSVLAPACGTAPPRDELAALMRRFPDG